MKYIRDTINRKRHKQLSLLPRCTQDLHNLNSAKAGKENFDVGNDKMLDFCETNLNFSCNFKIFLIKRLIIVANICCSYLQSLDTRVTRICTHHLKKRELFIRNPNFLK